jgi:AraC-like DNA-binding protein
MFPEVTLVDGRIVTEQNGLYSSGGATSYWNLLLHLIEKYAGRDMALMATKIYVLEIDRKTQSPFVIFRGQKKHEDETIKRAQEFIESKIDERISIDGLAQQFAIGKRHFERRFKDATNNTPSEYIQRVKIEAAKKLLESSNKNNSAHDLYLGLTINDDEFSPTGEFLPQGDGFLFYFDNDHNGTLFEPDDDVLSVNAGLPQFFDNYVVGMPVPSSTQSDIDGGGTQNGVGAASRIDRLNHFEMRHPLCSGDSLDFCLQTSDIVGFQLQYLDAESDGSFGGVYFFPGVADTETADIAIGDCTIPDLLFVFLPVLLR